MTLCVLRLAPYKNHFHYAILSATWYEISCENEDSIIVQPYLLSCFVL